MFQIILSLKIFFKLSFPLKYTLFFSSYQTLLKIYFQFIFISFFIIILTIFISRLIEIHFNLFIAPGLPVHSTGIDEVASFFLVERKSDKKLIIYTYVERELI